MKKIIFVMVLLCITSKGFSQTPAKLKDGIYIIIKIVKDTLAPLSKSSNQAMVHFNSTFLENAPDSALALLVDTKNFVPLELDQEPKLVDQSDTKKKLQLSFSRVAADKLQRFTAANLMKHAALIVDGEALTAHKIRAAITGGQMEISRCNDNACEHIYLRLKENVKH